MKLSGGLQGPLYLKRRPASLERVALAKAEIQAGLGATDWSQRQSRISTAISRVVNARDQFGSNMNFQLGKGNLMF